MECPAFSSSSVRARLALFEKQSSGRSVVDSVDNSRRRSGGASVPGIESRSVRINGRISGATPPHHSTEYEENMHGTKQQRQDRLSSLQGPVALVGPTPRQQEQASRMAPAKVNEKSEPETVVVGTDTAKVDAVCRRKWSAAAEANSTEKLAMNNRRSLGSVPLSRMLEPDVSIPVESKTQRLVKASPLLKEKLTLFDPDVHRSRQHNDTVFKFANPSYNGHSTTKEGKVPFVPNRFRLEGDVSHSNTTRNCTPFFDKVTSSTSTEEDPSRRHSEQSNRSPIKTEARRHSQVAERFLSVVNKERNRVYDIYPSTQPLCGSPRHCHQKQDNLKLNEAAVRSSEGTAVNSKPHISQIGFLKSSKMAERSEEDKHDTDTNGRETLTACLSLRPGRMRGKSCDGDEEMLPPDSNMQNSSMRPQSHRQNHKEQNEDYHHSRRHPVYSFRSEVVRGVSIDCADEEILTFLREKKDGEQGNNHESTFAAGSSLRPGRARGESLHGDKETFPTSQNNETKKGTEECEAYYEKIEIPDEPRRRPVNSLRPGVVRGQSFDRDDDRMACTVSRADLVDRCGTSDDQDEVADEPRRRPVNSLRPGVVRGLSFDRDDDRMACTVSRADLVDRCSTTDDQDEVADEPRRRPVNSLRPGVVRGLSFDRDDDRMACTVSRADLVDRCGTSDDQDEVADEPRRRPVNSLRPGVVRGLSFDRDDDRMACTVSRADLVDRCSTTDDQDHEVSEEPRRRPVNSLRPGVTRGQSFDRDDDRMACTVSRADLVDRCSTTDDQDHEVSDEPRRRPVNSLRPGVTRGQSFDRDDDRMACTVSRADLVDRCSTTDDQDHEVADEPRRRPVNSLRPGVVRGQSFDRDDDRMACAVSRADLVDRCGTTDDQDHEAADEPRRRPVNSLRPGVVRGQSFDRDDDRMACTVSRTNLVDRCSTTDDVQEEVVQYVGGVRDVSNLPMRKEENSNNSGRNVVAVCENRNEDTTIPCLRLHPRVVRNESFDRNDAVMSGMVLGKWSNSVREDDPANNTSRPPIRRRASYRLMKNSELERSFHRITSV